MRPRTIFGILLVLVAFVAFGSALIAVGSQQVAEAFGCQVDLNRAIPCVIGGKDYGQTFYDLGFWYSYLSLPAGLAVFGVWALAALIAILVSWRRQNRPPSAPLSPGKSFLRGALICVVIVLMITAFLPGEPPPAILHSRIAPYVLDGAHLLSLTTSPEMKQQFRQTYEKAKKAWVDPVREKFEKIEQ